MSQPYWFNRMVEYWTMPTDIETVVEHVRRARIQVVLSGNFGPDFYSLADDDTVARSWPGLVLNGVSENLAHAAELIPRLKEAGARVVGQLSMTMHFGDCDRRKGLFGEVWERMWTDDLLGPAPCASAAEVCQRDADGSLRSQEIDGRPYRTYRGCMSHPQWLAVVKAMVRKGIELGLDGFNATHNYESLCNCDHCSRYLRPLLEEELAPEEITRLFGTADLEEVADIFCPNSNCPQSLRTRFDLLLARAGGRRRKEAFDEVFVDCGRSLKPGLLLAQWNHKYDFSPHDERSLLPADLWGKGEDFIWYSQGPFKWGSSLSQGYLADMGLPSRFMYAAGGGRPFVVNKYDYRRWRVWAAEAAAHGGVAVAFHAGPPTLEQEESGNIAPEDYYGPVIRYQRFMAAQESVLHPATPWSQIALVYPRRAELEAEMDCLDALKRLGQLLEDGHWLFDIILDEQLMDRVGDYDALILPEVKRLSEEEATALEEFASGGGSLVFTGGTGTRQLEGTLYDRPLLAQWRAVAADGERGGGLPVGDGRTLYIEDGPWQATTVPIDGLDGEMPIHPRLDQDPFGQQFLKQLTGFLRAPRLTTDAPWHVRVRAWRPQTQTVDALVLHWINYLQEEETAIEVPIPIGPLQAECDLPAGCRVDRIEWLYPEMPEPTLLEHEFEDSRVRFTIPRLIVYGMSVVYLRTV